MLVIPEANTRRDFHLDTQTAPFDPRETQIPSSRLLTYYILSSLLSGPLIVISLPFLWMRYMTLRYEFEESGLRMRVGMLFRNETITAYRRIQDIHLTSNVLQRWLGIASISIQTASASMAPEIVIEGVSEPEKLRDWLYQRLRGTQPVDAVVAVSENDSENASLVNDEVTQLLTEIRDNLARLVDRDSRGGS